MSHTKEEFARVLRDRLINSRMPPVDKITALLETDPGEAERLLKQGEDENIIVAALGIAAGGKFVGPESTEHFRRCIADEMDASAQHLKVFAGVYDKAGNDDVAAGRRADELSSVLMKDFAERAIKFRTLAGEYESAASELRKEADGLAGANP